MYKSKLLLLSIIMLVSAFNTLQAGPHFWITNLDNSEFPLVKINFSAINRFDQPENKQNLTVDDFLVFENEIDMQLRNGEQNLFYKCGEATQDVPLSVVLAIDVTQSLTAGPTNYLEWIQDAANLFLDSLDFEVGSEVNTVRWAGSAETDGWMDNRGAVKAIIDDLDLKVGTTNFNPAFMSPTGAIEQFKTAKENTRKVIIFLTDGEHRYQDDPDSFDYEAVIEAAQQEGIEIFTIQMNEGNQNFRLGLLADATGGEAEFVTSKSQLETLFQDFVFRLSAADFQCYLEYTSSVPCKEDILEREVRVDFVKYAQTDSDLATLQIPEEFTKQLSYDNTKFYFSETGTLNHTFNVTALNGDFEITGFEVVPDNSNFSIAPENFTLQNGRSQAVTITFDETIQVDPANYEFRLLTADCNAPNLELVATCNAVTSEMTQDVGQVPVGAESNFFIDITNQIDEEITGTLTLTNDANNVFTLVSNENLSIPALGTANVELSYNPLASGAFEGSLDFNFNSDCGTLSIDLSGEGIESSIIVSNYPFGGIRLETGSVGTLEITNTSGLETQITGIGFSDDATTEFEFVDDLSNEYPIALASNESYSFDVRFTPSALSAFEQGIEVTTQNGVDVFFGVLTGEGTLPNVNAEDLDFGVYTEATTTTLPLVIENLNSNEDLVISEIRIQNGSDAENNFTVVNPLTTNITIMSGSSFETDIEFNATTNGVKNAIIEIIHNSEIGDTNVDEVYEVNLTGEIQLEIVEVSIEDLDFGNVFTCDQDIQEIVITNSNQFNIDVNLFIDPTNTNFVVLDPQPITLAPGENNINIGAIVGEVGAVSSNLTVRDLDGNDLASAELTANATKQNGTLEIINLQQGVELTVNKPIEYQFNLDVTNLPNRQTDYQLFIEYNSSQLYFDEVQGFDIEFMGTPVPNTINVEDVANTLNKVIEINLDLSSIDFEVLTFNVPFRTLLHNEDITTIIFSGNEEDCFQLSSAQMQVTIDGCANEFTAINAEGSYNIEKIYPNPIMTDFNVDYSIALDGRTTVSLYDINGNLINTLIDTELSPGKYQLNVPIKNIHSGIYFLRFEQREWNQTEKIMIAR